MWTLMRRRKTIQMKIWWKKLSMRCSKFMNLENGRNFWFLFLTFSEIYVAKKLKKIKVKIDFMIYYLLFILNILSGPKMPIKNIFQFIYEFTMNKTSFTSLTHKIKIDSKKWLINLKNIQFHCFVQNYPQHVQNWSFEEEKSDPKSFVREAQCRHREIFSKSY